MSLIQFIVTRVFAPQKVMLGMWMLPSITIRHLVLLLAKKHRLMIINNQKMDLTWTGLESFSYLSDGTPHPAGWGVETAFTILEFGSCSISSRIKMFFILMHGKPVRFFKLMSIHFNMHCRCFFLKRHPPQFL